MKRLQKHCWNEATLWLIAEICLNLSGLDTLADYSEFLLNQHIHSYTSYTTTLFFASEDKDRSHVDAIGRPSSASPLCDQDSLDVAGHLLFHPQ